MMSKSKKEVTKKKRPKKTSPKKDLQDFIVTTMEKTLGKLKEGMSEKKFNSNIKKAAKLIAGDFKLPGQKKTKLPTAVKEPAKTD